MTLTREESLNLRALIAQRHDGQLMSEEGSWLRTILAANPEARRVFAGYNAMYALLELEVAALDDMLRQSPAELPSTAPSLSLEARQNHVVAPSSLELGFLGNTLHGAIGFFSQEIPFSLLIATVVTGLALWIGSLINVSRDVEIARESVPPIAEPSRFEKIEYVGHITGTVDCKWADPNTAAINGVNVRLGRKYALASGLMEITYDTGTKVILQGPVTYEVESNGGYLSVGKLTAKLEKGGERRGERGEGAANHKSEIRNQKSSLSTIHDPLFTIKTPTATVTDLGTEFGVEARQDGGTEVHVLDGQVDLVTRTGSTRIRLAANSEQSAARVEAGAANIVRLPAAPQRFVRVMPTAVQTEWLCACPQGSFMPAKDNLLRTSLVSASTNDNPAPFDGALSALYDGTMYGPNNEEIGTGNAYHGFSVRNGKCITFALDTRDNKQGYTIKSIDVYTGYTWSRVGQKYKVEFGRVGQDDWLPSPVVKFSRRAYPYGDLCEARSHICSRVPYAPLATNVNRIRFTFYNQNEGLTAEEQQIDYRGTNGGTGIYREIDVIGVPSREAASTTSGHSERSEESSPEKEPLHSALGDQESKDTTKP